MSIDASLGIQQMLNERPNIIINNNNNGGSTSQFQPTQRPLVGRLVVVDDQ